MLADWRHAYANTALTGGNLAFLLIALKSPTPAGVGISAGLVGITSLYAWYVNLRRFSAVADTPTARISSAPQGYVEIVGKGVHTEGSQLISPTSGLPCLWYRFIVEKKHGNKWRRVGGGVSTEPFGIDDGTGEALVEPDQAEIITSRKQVTTRGQHRHTEWNLIEGETLYVLGEHATIGGANAVLDLRQDVSALLSAWKRDWPALVQRFDLNGDGGISLDEWERAREAALENVTRQHQETRLEPGMHLLRKPPGRLYLIANRTPRHLASRYRFWAWTHLGLVAAACLALAGLL
ncbi:hypothetical protein F8A87_10150 [Betaproteobacteria bacterium SCN2]|jgi:hypothetical protein|nr:hypothetical protein F8A87_10150 [Betaproteobacteria bacterium SCN2]